MIQGDFEGRTYLIEPFPTDFEDEATGEMVPAYRVQRNRGGGPYDVMLNPQSCNCGWYENKVGSFRGYRDCIHVRALRHLLKGVKDGEMAADSLRRRRVAEGSGRGNHDSGTLGTRGNTDAEDGTTSR